MGAVNNSLYSCIFCVDCYYLSTSHLRSCKSNLRISILQEYCFLESRSDPENTGNLQAKPMELLVIWWMYVGSLKLIFMNVGWHSLFKIRNVTLYTGGICCPQGN
jgi:hypothetical protein